MLGAGLPKRGMTGISHTDDWALKASSASRMKSVTSRCDLRKCVEPARKIFESANDIELLGCGSSDFLPGSAITLFLSDRAQPASALSWARFARNLSLRRRWRRRCWFLRS